jgi:hypothetical protein
MKEINNNQRYSSFKEKSNEGSIKYFHNYSSYSREPKLEAFIRKLTIEAKVKKEEVEKFIKILLQN